MRHTLILVLLILSESTYSQSYVKLGDVVGNNDKAPYKWIQEGDFQVTTTTSNYVFSFSIRGVAGNIITIEWGDGSYNIYTFTGSNTTINHTYASPGQYNIFFTGDVDKIQLFSNIQPIMTGTINARFKKWIGLKNIQLRSAGNVNIKGGNIANLSNVTDTIALIYCNKVSGSVDDLSDQLKYLALDGSSQLLYTGNLERFKRLRLLRIYLGASFAKFGKINLSNLSDSLVSLYLWNAGDSILGSVDTLNRKKFLRSLVLQNANRRNYTANIDSLYLLSILNCEGPGLTGSINNLIGITGGLTISNAPNITGSINSAFLPNVSTISSVIINNCPGVSNNDIKYLKKVTGVLQFNGNGETYGSIDSLRKTLGQLMLGSSSGNYSGITGSLENISPSVSLLTLQGVNVSYSGGTLPAWSNGNSFIIQSSFTESELRSFLINWASTAANKTTTVNVAGTNAPIHVNQTDDPTLYNAIQTLISKGKTITFNAY